MSEMQPDMFAKTARDAALDRVWSNAGEDWNSAAIRTIAGLSGEMTGEDIRLAVEPIVGAPHHHNAWGAVIRTALKRGHIQRTGQWRHMKTEKSHARMTPVYRARA